MEKSKKLSYKSVVALGFLVYFFSYAMRLDYSASIVAIVSDLKITNTMASAAVTGSFITYGVGQVICGIIGDKVSPTKMISVAMLGTILVNTLVSFSNNIWVITALWCINGVCQAMIWPPLTRFISEQVGSDKYANAVTVAGLSVSTGTIFVYLFVPVVLKYTIWRNVFRCMSLFGVVMMLIWFLATRGIKMGKAEGVKKADSNKTISVFGLIALAGLIPIFLAIALQGILRDGIQTWLPSLVNKQFNLDESSSVLSAAILPIFSMVCVLVANALNNKIKHELKTAAIMFGFSFISTIPIVLGVKIPIITVICAALISASMHGVNHMLIALIPKNFAKYGMVSTFSGILNACTYIGASVSSYGFAAISDIFDWNAVLISWCIIAFLGTAICAFKIKGWTKFIAK
ncbi:MAG: MFS transporter [Clostridia bacterium]|nr:MFS transporter [Clostridia bacterium]